MGNHNSFSFAGASSVSSSKLISRHAFEESWSLLGKDALDEKEAASFVRGLLKSCGIKSKETMLRLVAESLHDGVVTKSSLETALRLMREELPLSTSWADEKAAVVVLAPVVFDDELRHKIAMLRGKLGRNSVFDVSRSADIFAEDLWRVVDGGGAVVKSNERGHSGLFFVELAFGKKVVLKSSDSVATEVVGGLFARFLGVASPEVRFVGRDIPEHFAIAKLLKERFVLCFVPFFLDKHDQAVQSKSKVECAKL
jgi:hypothetical protein